MSKTTTTKEARKHVTTNLPMSVFEAFEAKAKKLNLVPANAARLAIASWVDMADAVAKETSKRRGRSKAAEVQETTPEERQERQERKAAELADIKKRMADGTYQVPVINKGTEALPPEYRAIKTSTPFVASPVEPAPAAEKKVKKTKKSTK